MKTLVAAAAVVGCLMTGTAYAAETLSDQQMDTVTAGLANFGTHVVMQGISGTLLTWNDTYTVTVTPCPHC